MMIWYDVANDIIDTREDLGIPVDPDHVMEVCELAADSSGYLPIGWEYND